MIRYDILREREEGKGSYIRGQCRERERGESGLPGQLYSCTETGCRERTS